MPERKLGWQTFAGLVFAYLVFAYLVSIYLKYSPLSWHFDGERPNFFIANFYSYEVYKPIDVHPA
jgi:hypothetical protein